ncbi:MAG TPA: radical SAM protein, partial [Desulfopila sp.]|nr:radical SAM protein [Desulfopila sp.]
LNIVRLLLSGGIEPFAEERASMEDSPLLICGGVATFMNPEPIAAFMDFCIIGEAEPLLDDFVTYLQHEKTTDRHSLYIDSVNRFAGVYAPALYTPKYENGRCIGLDAVAGVPARVSRVSVAECDVAAHSTLMSPLAEFSDLYLTELGRGCSRGCRFCAAGFIYRPPRLWDADAVVRGLSRRSRQDTRVGLLGMEMADGDTLEVVGSYLLKSSCALSFSSLRADRISDGLLELLSNSSLKSAAIAPDGASERLRRVINKGLDQADLLQAALRLTEAGIYKLKLYVMVGLPTETQTDLEEFIRLVHTMKESIDDIGRKRGRLTEIYLSVNCFVPKPWTPFQYHPFALDRRLEVGKTASMQQALRSLKEKIAFLKNGMRPFANVHFQADKPESALFQALLSRGDRRLAGVLFDAASGGVPWKSSARKRGIVVEKLILSGCDSRSYFPWYVIDHGISHDYLWDEYEKAFTGTSTMPCDTAVCRRCGVCRGR